MRVEDLGISALVQFDAEEGVTRFAGERALIIDATAKGNLRKELISHFGVSAARAVLTRFGFVQGWPMAEAMRGLFEWESEEDWHRACARMHMLEGIDLNEGNQTRAAKKLGFGTATLYRKLESYRAGRAGRDTPPE